MQATTRVQSEPEVSQGRDDYYASIAVSVSVLVLVLMGFVAAYWIGGNMRENKIHRQR